MVKNVYYWNEDLGLAWDCIEVFQVALFITTKSKIFLAMSDYCTGDIFIIYSLYFTNQLRIYVMFALQNNFGYNPG